tara:strand:+ start:173 stop:493 length:321 start_codon:yes stop_codon:yes gene_type:complete
MQSLDFSRSDRLSDQVRDEIAIILREEVKDPRLKGLTIIRVEISKDIKKAYIYFSPINSFNQANLEDVLLGFEKAKGFIRSLLGKRMNVKRVPEIFLEEDKLEKLS